MVVVKDLITQLEEQIDEAKRRAEVLDKKWPLNAGIIDEQEAVAEIIKDLQRKLSAAKRDGLRRTFGLPVEQEAPPKRLAPRALSMPHRIFNEGDRKRYPSKLDPDDDQSKEFQKIREGHWNADAQAKVEDDFQKTLKIFVDGRANREVAFTQGIYGSLICVIALMQSELDSLREFGGIKRREMEARIVVLEQDREQLKTKLANFRYLGTWRPNHIYAEGNSVTRGGSLWIALKDNGVEPGGNDACWQLAVKRGRDAKEMR